MDWNNIDLNDSWERDLPLIDSLSFDTLLLEVECNCRVINETTVWAQFEADLLARITGAREIMQANLKNITTKAKETRNE